jgi:polysaccharide export outer membrane protein
VAVYDAHPGRYRTRESIAMIKKMCLGLVCVILIAGCGTTGNVADVLPPPQNIASSDNELNLPSRPEVPVATLGPEDKLRITVYEHDDLSQEVTLGPDGGFEFPLLGKVQASGMTVEQLQQYLTKELGRDYIVDPQVSVTVLESRNRHVFVLGAVGKPGVYPLQYHASVLELLTQAGGVRDDASWYAWYIPAGEQSAARGTKIDLEKLLSGEIRPPIRLQNGDTIYVPQGAFVYVTGEVEKPGRYPLKRYTTVDRAIILAGGFTKFAAKKRIRVRRMVNGQQKEYHARSFDELQDEDVVIVPESLL